MKNFKPRFNADRLKDRDTRRMYCKAVRRTLEGNRAEGREEIEELWETQRKAYVESAPSQRGYGTRSGRSTGRRIRT